MDRRWVGWIMVALACGGGDVEATGDASSSSGDPGSSSGGPSTTAPTTSTTGVDDSSSSSGDTDTSSSSGSSSEDTGPPTGEPLRAILVDDVAGDGEVWAYLVTWDGAEPSAPTLVHGPAPADGEIGVAPVTADLLLGSTHTADGSSSYVLIPIDGVEVGEPAPLVLAPAPLGDAAFPEFLEEGRVLFGAADDPAGPQSLWSAAFDGAVAQPPERVSPEDATASYTTRRLTEAHDAVLALRQPVGGGAEDLVWLPHAPADPDAAIVVVDHDEAWAQIDAFGFAPDGESIWYKAPTDDTDRAALFVDDLDPASAAIAVHTEVGPGETVRGAVPAPDGSAFVYWVGVYDPPETNVGDMFVVPWEGITVGMPVDVLPSDGVDYISDTLWSGDARWLVFLSGDLPGARMWIVRVADGMPVAAVELPESGISGGDFDPASAYFYYYTNDALQRVALAGDTIGAPELVTAEPPEGLLRFTNEGPWIGFVGRDHATFDWATYVVDVSQLPAPAIRIDAPPRVGATPSIFWQFSRDDRYAITQDNAEGDASYMVRVTSLADPGISEPLGMSRESAVTLPAP